MDAMIATTTGKIFHQSLPREEAATVSAAGSVWAEICSAGIAETTTVRFDAAPDVAAPDTGAAATPETETAAGWEMPVAVRPESLSRFSRLRSARNSAALWQRRSRSFSSTFATISSNFGGRLGFTCEGAVGVRRKIAST